MEWLAENLNVNKFLNGDLIPYAKSNDEWQHAAKNRMPAWCYINGDSSTNQFGKLYNWYAVHDSRGLSVSGKFRIPTIQEWKLLINYMAYLEKIDFCVSDKDIFTEGNTYPPKLSPVFNKITKQLKDQSYGYAFRLPNGQFHNSEGSHNGWWCVDGSAADDLWYCSPSVFYWGIVGPDEEWKGRGYRIMLLRN